MEKERFFGGPGHLQPTMESNYPQHSDQLLPPCFLNLNWDHSVEQSSNFGSALSSIVSSPTNPSSAGRAVMGELIGRLGSICNSGDISPPAHQFLGGGGGKSSGYTTPSNSPSKLPISGNMAQLPPFGTGSGFSLFGGENPSRDFERRHKVGNMNIQTRSATPEESSVCEHACNNTRKRKSLQKGGRAKDLPVVAEDGKLDSKRTKSDGQNEIKLKAEPSSSTYNSGGEQKPEKESSPKVAEASKQDYIHVRARRGQATDSHSLAERVRREKISERMKFLQDLVPGCNKVTGKAVMLDEIINYVQSLQRQVEFLSMKLATVNPRMDFNMESLLQKDMHLFRASLPNSGYPPEISGPAFPFSQQPPQSASLQSGHENHCPVNSLEATLKISMGMQLPSLDGFGEFSSQAGVFWDDDLQNVVQMGFGQNQESVLSSSAIHGALPTAHMKVEL